MTPENVRFHAAGHLAAAHALASNGMLGGAKYVLGIVKQYAGSPRVSSPPILMEMLDAAIDDPSAQVSAIAALEQWFCDPFNTVIEKSGAKFT